MQQPLELARAALEPAQTPEFWDNFKKYLQTSQNAKTVADRLLYARKFAEVLTNYDAQCLLGLSVEKRNHAMKALACLSKYTGQYNEWKQIKEQFQLKWETSDGIRIFQSMMNSDEDYSAMIRWLKEAYSTLPASYSNILIYACLV
jgi:hypothetical protein